MDLFRQNGKAAVSLVTEESGHIVGHVLFSPVTMEPSQPGLKLLGLAPVALLGEPSYYKRFGFCQARDFCLDNEYGVDEKFRVLELQPGSLTLVRGTVRHAPEFAVID